MKKAGNVDAYIGQFPAATQAVLKQVRAAVLKAAPKAEESISYGMPAYKVNDKALVYFAGYDKHIGFYATPTGHEAFKKELAGYKQGKGSVQFPLEEKMPLALITKIVQFRLAENKEKAKEKNKQVIK